MERLVYVAAIVLLFYVLIPGIGAFAARARWRSFRRRIIDASLRPTAGYVQLRADEAGSGYLGVFRCFASLEAIQGDDTVWIRDGRVSFAVRMTDVSVYMLPSGLYPPGGQPGSIELSDEMPAIVPWAKVGSLPEGTRLFVCGPLYISESKAVFRSDAAADLTVVIYDGDERTLLQRSIWSGRQRNEYWNRLTPLSLACGSLSLIVLASVHIASPWLRSTAILAVAGSLVPVLPLGPPGVALFFVYRRLWQQARYLRAERDLLRLPVRFHDAAADTAPRHDQPIRLPDGELYARKAVAAEDQARLLEQGARLRAVSVLKQPGEDAVCFCALSDSGEPKQPDDPLAEFVLVPGDPNSIAKKCQRKAQLLETVSLAAFAAGLLMNLYLALVIINAVIQ